MLYEKYNLTQEEIDYIESTIKSMVIWETGLLNTELLENGY